MGLLTGTEKERGWPVGKLVPKLTFSMRPAEGCIYFICAYTGHFPLLSQAACWIWDGLFNQELFKMCHLSIAALPLTLSLVCYYYSLTTTNYYTSAAGLE